MLYQTNLSAGKEFSISLLLLSIVPIKHQPLLKGASRAGGSQLNQIQPACRWPWHSVHHITVLSVLQSYIYSSLFHAELRVQTIPFLCFAYHCFPATSQSEEPHSKHADMYLWDEIINDLWCTRPCLYLLHGNVSYMEAIVELVAGMY